MTPLLAPQASERRYRGVYESHAHGHAQLLVGLAGHLAMEVQGHATFVDASCALVVPAGVAHAYEAAHETRVLVFDTAPRGGLDRLRRWRVPSASRVRASVAAGATTLDALLDELLGAPRVLARAVIRLDRVDDAVQADLHGVWSTARLAALFGLSAQRFHARFVELTGETPMSHVRRIRLAAAARLLRRGWTLDAVALQTGYATASALATALRREFGAGARGLRRHDRLELSENPLRA